MTTSKKPGRPRASKYDPVETQLMAAWDKGGAVGITKFLSMPCINEDLWSEIRQVLESRKFRGKLELRVTRGGWHVYDKLASPAGFLPANHKVTVIRIPPADIFKDEWAQDRWSLCSYCGTPVKHQRGPGTILVLTSCPYVIEDHPQFGKPGVIGRAVVQVIPVPSL